MKKTLKIVLGKLGAVFLLLVVVGMFSEEDKPSTGTSASSGQNSTNKVAKGTKVIDATNEVIEVNGLTVALGEIKLSKDKIQVGLNVENTGGNTVTFYPDQGSAVIGNLQLDANLFLTSGDVSGEIHSGVLKEGVIEYLAPEGKEIDVASISQIKLVFGDVFDDTTYDAEEVTFTLSVQ